MGLELGSTSAQAAKLVRLCSVHEYKNNELGEVDTPEGEEDCDGTIAEDRGGRRGLLTHF